MKSKITLIENDLFTIRKLLLIIGLICFIFGIVAVTVKWRNLGSLLLLASVLIFSYLYFLNQKYKEYKKIYFEHLPKKNVSEMLNYGSFEFTNEYLIYKTKNDFEKINWTDLSSYLLIDKKHVLIYRKNESETNLIISETEMDKSDFSKAFEYIKERVKKNYLQHRV